MGDYIWQGQNPHYKTSQKNRSKMAQSKNNMINMLSSFSQILLIYTLFQILISPLMNQTEANSNTIEFDEDYFIEEVLLDRAEPLSGFLSSVGVLLVAGVSSRHLGYNQKTMP